jgi:uncharacterized LabA/DUF88 family protein
MVNRKIYKDEESKNNMILPGNPQGLPDDFLNVIVFIDNAYLIRLKNYFFKEKFSYSLKYFIEGLARKNNFFVRNIYLYDAPPFQSMKPNEKEKKMKEDYDKFVSFFRKEGIVVREGRTQRLKIGNSFIYHQKGVDMLLGIDMVGVLKEFPKLNTVVLVSGDSDFVPAVEKVKSFDVKVILWTYFERNRKSPFSRSNHLINSVDEFIKLTKEDFEEVKNEN